MYLSYDQKIKQKSEAKITNNYSKFYLDIFTIFVSQPFTIL